MPTSERGGKERVATDALEALGKRADVTGKPRNATGLAELVPIWLTAHRTRLLIVAACQRTPAADLLALVEMTQATPTRRCSPRPRVRATRCETLLPPPTRFAWPDLPDTHPGANGARASARTATGPASPKLPAVEYWTFYATAKRQLNPEQFAPVHDLYCDTMTRLTTWLGDLATPEPT